MLTADKCAAVVLLR